jgi:type IV secretion system protein VirB9
MKINHLVPIITASLILPCLAQEFDANGLPIGFAEKTQQSLNQAPPIKIQKDPVDPHPPEPTETGSSPQKVDVAPSSLQQKKVYPTKQIKAAMDEMPSGKYIGKLPDDLYMQLAAGTEAEHALQLLAKWEANKESPLLKFNGNLQYTYGSGTPLVLVKPSDLTDIELQEGERINDILIGDRIRWTITPTMNGSDDGITQTSHVIVKAKKPNLTTTLIVTTNRRTYRMRLVSSSMFHLPHVSFTYPEDYQDSQFESYLQEIAQLEEAKKAVLDSQADAHRLQIESLEAELAERESQEVEEKYKAKALKSPVYLDFNYAIKNKKGRPTWTPTSCYSDGQKTYIVMPRSMPSGEAPIVLVKDGKEKEMVNYRLIGNKFVVDRVFETAVLVSGVGFSRKEVHVVRNYR